jgi:hypothetical protein
MSQIQRKKEWALSRLFLGELSTNYKSYLQELSKRKADVLKLYSNEIEKPENKSQGYVYPFKNDVYKFDTKYLGDLILIQEIILRTLIVKSLKYQSFQKLHFNSLLPLEGRKLLSSAFAILIRYKRLYDLFYRAASIRLKSENFDIKKFWSFESKDEHKEIVSKYHLPTIEQYETLIKYSLDTPFCLNIILGLNRLKQYGPDGIELISDNKTSYTPSEGKKIKLGEKKKIPIYLFPDGKIKDSNGTEYDVIGISAGSFDKSIIDNRKEEPNETTIDIIKSPDTVSLIFKSIIDRFTGQEYLPTNDNWALKWTKDDDVLHESFRLKFAVKSPEREPSSIVGKMYTRRQVIELPYKTRGGKRNKTVKNRI